jgi:restriction system protein
MKLRMSDKSVFAILLRSPWWISIGLMLVIALAARALMPEAYVAVGVMGGFPFLVIGVIAAWRQWRAPNPAQVAEALKRAGAMSWRDFSETIQEAFARQGFAVTRLDLPAADFRLEKGGRTTLVSCKRWKAATQGIEPLRALVDFTTAQDATHCSFITLGSLSGNAQRFAGEHAVQLVSGDGLAQLLTGKK